MTNPPKIIAASSFIGLGVISTDKYVENGGTGPDGNAKQWFINTVSSLSITYPSCILAILFYKNIKYKGHKLTDFTLVLYYRETFIAKFETLSLISQQPKLSTSQHCTTKLRKPQVCNSSPFKHRQHQIPPNRQFVSSFSN